MSLKTKMWIRFTALFSLALTVAGYYHYSLRARDSRLNVLLVTLDTTRADRIGCYGYGAAMTPALDQLAARGVLIERAYVPRPKP